MTTIIVTNNYLIADHRSTYDLICRGAQFSIKDSVVKEVQSKGESITRDNIIKISLFKDDEVFYMEGKKAIAWAMAGKMTSWGAVFESINFTKEVESLDYLVKTLLFKLRKEQNKIIFYIENGDSVLVDLENSVLKVFRGEYFQVFGSGSDVETHLDLSKEFYSLPLNEIYSVLAITCPYTSLSYSVLGRREKEFFPYVKEDQEAFIEKAKRLREKHSFLFNPNNVY